MSNAKKTLIEARNTASGETKSLLRLAVNRIEELETALGDASVILRASLDRMSAAKRGSDEQ